jgi:hypothetical protein
MVPLANGILVRIVKLDDGWIVYIRGERRTLVVHHRIVVILGAKMIDLVGVVLDKIPLCT